MVCFREKRFPGLVWTGEWHVTSLLPEAGGEPQYRIESPDRQRERVIGEQHLTPPAADSRAYPAA